MPESGFGSGVVDRFAPSQPVVSGFDLRDVSGMAHQGQHGSIATLGHCRLAAAVGKGRLLPLRRTAGQPQEVGTFDLALQPFHRQQQCLVSQHDRRIAGHTPQLFLEHRPVIAPGDAMIGRSPRKQPAPVPARAAPHGPRAFHPAPHDPQPLGCIAKNHAHCRAERSRFANNATGVLQRLSSGRLRARKIA